MAVVAPHLTCLPLEILLHISEHLTAFELVRLSRTCQSLRHLSDCENFALVLMRQGSAEEAIDTIRITIHRMDLAVEVFRHVKDRKHCYPFVATLAASLNDMEQLEAWRAEFGFTPPEALKGAIKSGRIETFDLALPLVELTDAVIDSVFVNIGSCGNRALLDHLLENRSEWVTPQRLERAVMCSALLEMVQFARDVFGILRSRTDALPINCACCIVFAAAYAGNIAVFSEFIDMTDYSAENRNLFAESAAKGNHVEILRLEEASNNRAESLGQALMGAVVFNSIDTLKYLLNIEQGVWNRISSDDLVEAFLAAIVENRSEMASRLMVHVPRGLLLRGAVDCAYFDDAMMLLKEYQKSDRQQVVEGASMPEYYFDEYSADVPDWQMTVWLVIFGLDETARLAKVDTGDAECARFLSVLPTAIDLARELDLSEVAIDQMTGFAQRPM